METEHRHDQIPDGLSRALSADAQELERLLEVPGNRQNYGAEGGSLIRDWFFEDDAARSAAGAEHE